MAMTAGSVDRTTINATTGNAGTWTGAAKVIYQWLIGYYGAMSPAVPAPAPTVGSTSSPFSVARPAASADVTIANNARLAQFRFWADQANMLAQLVSYIQTFAGASITSLQATMTTQVAGTLPNPPNAGASLVPPGAGSPIHLPCDQGIFGTELPIV